jgi:hypothetical protein
LLGPAGLTGVKVKDTDFNVKGNAKLVAFEEDNAGPGGIEVVEDAGVCG